MADRAWKAFERRVARLLGTERIPSGWWGTIQSDAPDVETDRLSIQVKLGYQQPSYLREWLSGIVAVAAGRGRTGVVVWSPKRGKTDDALVIMRLADFVRLVDDGPDSPGAES